MDIDLDAVWTKLGFKTKRDAIRALEKSFTEGTDYRKGEALAKTAVGRPPTKIYLSESCHSNLGPVNDTERRKLEIIKKLQRERGGEINSNCRFGVIDLLTETEIIVVEPSREWIRGIGKLAVFGNAMDTPRLLKLFLFECAPQHTDYARDFLELSKSIDVEFL